MDEYVRIFRNDVWFIPPRAPTITDARIIIDVDKLIFIRYEISIMGAAFCTVIINKQFIHLNPSITLGNHQCNGAAPIFSSKGIMIVYSCISFLRGRLCLDKAFIITRNIRVDEAKA